MKKIIEVLVMISIVTYSLTGCKKVVRENEAFVGEWRGVNGICNITVSIPSSGKGLYYKLCDSTFVEAKGIPYLKSKKSILKIGKKEFQITSNPKEPSLVVDSTGSHTKISLDGILYTKLEQ